MARCPVDLRAVICNEPNASGVERAKNAGLEVAIVSHRDFATRERFDAALSRAIDRRGAELVVLAGFMRILTTGFVRRYQGRIINIHPSLLPDFPGVDTHSRAIAAGAQEHGATVHFVTADLDAGPIIAQGARARSSRATNRTRWPRECSNASTCSCRACFGGSPKGASRWTATVSSWTAFPPCVTPRRHRHRLHAADCLGTRAQTVRAQPQPTGSRPTVFHAGC